MSRLDQWLESIGLSQYSAAFADNDIDLEILDEITEADLKELGLSLGHRKKLLKALRALHRVSSDTDVDDGAVVHPVSPAQAQPEKRFLSLVFCDLADSTRIAAALDMEDAHALNRAFQEACTQAIHGQRGYVARYMGDGILAYFGYPRAHENDAEQAVNAGLDIIRYVTELGPRFSLPEDLDLAVRVGIASGPVVVETIGDMDARENAVVGEAPNLAARLQGLAAPNSVLVGEDTYHLVQDSFEFEDQGSRQIKGYSDTMATWQVMAARSPEERNRSRSDRHLTNMVGRREELGLLKSRWERSTAGAGQVVLLSAEAGMGKTRLVDALLAEIEGNCRRVRLFCSANHIQSPLYPVFNRLQREAELLGDNAGDTPRERLRHLMATRYQYPETLLPAVLSLVYMETDEGDTVSANPGEVMRILQQRLVETLLKQSRNQPTLVVLEDAHWVDASTQGVMDLLAERIHDHAIMLLVTHRLEKQLPYTSAHVTRLTLSSLSRDQAARLITGITGELPESAVREISEKGAGIPLFLEEITKSLQARSVTESPARVNNQTIPESLQASLLSALDRLGEAKRLAQIGAVIGQSFWKDVLTFVTNQPSETLESGLNQLVDNRITVRESLGDNALLRFRHALLRDAAYESLMRGQRAELHGRVATFLAQSGKSEERANQAVIARHYEVAGDLDKAFSGWLEAGRTALNAGATTEAVELLERAHSLADRVSGEGVLPDRHYQLHMSRGQALNASRGAAATEAHESFRRAAAIGQEMDDVYCQVDALDYLYGITFNAGRLVASMDVAHEMLGIGEARNHPVALVSGHQGLGMTLCTLGRFAEAARHLEAALGHADQDIKGINCFPSMTMDYLSYVRFFLGDDKAAQTLCEQAIRSARKESQYAAVTALSNSCFTQMLLGDYEAVRLYSGQAMQLARERGQYMVSDRALLFHNLATAWLEPEAETLQDVEAAIERLFQSREYIDLTYLIAMAAEVQIQRGHLEDAGASLARALAISDETGEAFYRAELCRLQAALALAGEANDSKVAATQWLDEGLALAKSQGAAGWLRRLDAAGRLWGLV